MAHQDQEYPLDASSYTLGNEIGRGVTATVYKATCNPLNSTVVAIKSIDLEKSKTDLENARREAKTLSLLSHPNILNAHCSFAVDRNLWVVMPFMSGGSLQSVMASTFYDGLPEPCIATVLKDVLNALSYLHGQGHLHRDIKAGNILIDSNGSVKLGDFGVSASIYESSNTTGRCLSEVTGTPYWMAPEVLQPHPEYSCKADIFSLGITALELACGRPPLSDIPLSKSMLMKMTKGFRFSDHYDGGRGSGGGKGKGKKKVSKGFKEMVAMCLEKDPRKRPSADKLIKHHFFKSHYKGADYLVKNVLNGLPPIEERYKRATTMMIHNTTDDDSDDDELLLPKQRRISGWCFNEEEFKLEPIFPVEASFDDDRKQVSFGGEVIIPEVIKGNRSNDDDQGASTANKSTSSVGDVISMDEMMVEKLQDIIKGCDNQRQMLLKLVAQCGQEQEMTTEEVLLVVVENLKAEVDSERRLRQAVEAQLEVEKKMQLEMASSADDDDGKQVRFRGQVNVPKAVEVPKGNKSDDDDQGALRAGSRSTSSEGCINTMFVERIVDMIKGCDDTRQTVLKLVAQCGGVGEVENNTEMTTEMTEMLLVVVQNLRAEANSESRLRQAVEAQREMLRRSTAIQRFAAV